MREAKDLLDWNEIALRDTTMTDDQKSYWMDKDTDLLFDEWLAERAHLAFIAEMEKQMLEAAPELAAMMTDKEYEAIREAFEITAAANLPADERFLP